MNKDNSTISLKTQVETYNDGQMIAETWLVAIAVEGAEWFHATINLVGYEQERGVVDEGTNDATAHGG